MDDFFRFPHTPHLAWLAGGIPRDDKVLDAREAGELLAGDVAVEEKVDGANLGLSLAPDGTLRVQNRGQYLVAPFGGQFARLPDWLAAHGDAIGNALLDASGCRLILFGEWCAARHSLDYTRLPDWFLLFDVLEVAAGRFWCSARRDALAARLGLETTPRVARGRLSLADLVELATRVPSRFRDGSLEGVVVRRESALWCEGRAKLVNPGFTQAIGEHWRKRTLQWNRLDSA